MSDLKYKIGDAFQGKENPKHIIRILEIGKDEAYPYTDTNGDLIDDELLDSLFDKIKVRTPEFKQIGGDHYSKLEIEPYEYSYKNNLNCLQFNIIKYVTRYPFKNKIEDLKKAKHTIDRLIEYEIQNK